jgi:hypothetical protein
MPTITVSWNAKGFINAGEPVDPNYPYTTWTNVRNAPDGVVYQAPSTTLAIGPDVYPGRGFDSYRLGRTYGWVDTNSYPNITQIDLSIPWGNSNGIQVFIVCKSFAFPNFIPTLPGTNLIPTDFNIGGSWDINTLYSGGDLFQANTTQTITLNAQAVTDANNNGYLNFILIDGGYDFANRDPITSGYGSYSGEFNYSVAAQATIIYGSSGYPNDVNGVISPNIGEVNGIATANISQIIGV